MSSSLLLGLCAAASPQTFQRKITVASSSPPPLIGVQERRRFKNLKTQTAYDHILRYLDSEKDTGENEEFPRKLQQILASPIDRTLTYVWEYSVERVLVRVYVPDDDDDDGDELEPVRLVVHTFRCNCVQLGFGIRIFHEKMIIDYVSFANELRPPHHHHVFNFSKHFDGDTQAAWYEHLELRHIWPSCLDYQKKKLLQLYHTYSPPQSSSSSSDGNSNI